MKDSVGMIGEFAALGAALSWTVSALLYKRALGETKPISANIVRLTLTGCVMTGFIVVAGMLHYLINLPLNLVVIAGLSGVIGLGIGDTLYMLSLKMIGVARAVPVTCTYPLFNLFWAAILAGEYITWPVALGAVVIVLGIWMLSSGADRKESLHLEERALRKGLALAVITAVLWSVSIAMMGIAVEETPDLGGAFAINTVRVLTIAVSFAATAPILDKSLGFAKMRKRTVATLVFAGIVALGIGWFLLSFSFIDTPQSRAVPISSVTPLFSTLAAIIFLHEKVNFKNVLGSFLIVAGIFIIFLL